MTLRTMMMVALVGELTALAARHPTWIDKASPTTGMPAVGDSCLLTQQLGPMVVEALDLRRRKRLARNLLSNIPLQPYRF